MNSLSLNNLKKNCLCVLSRFSHVQLFVTLWTVALEAPLSIGFCRQEHSSGLSCPPPGGSSWHRDRTCASCGFCVAGSLFTPEPPGKPWSAFMYNLFKDFSPYPNQPGCSNKVSHLSSSSSRLHSLSSGGKVWSWTGLGSGEGSLCVLLPCRDYSK